MEIRVPTFPESVAEGTLINWLVAPGEAVAADQIIAEIETDKVVFEVPCPGDGVLAEQLVAADGTVTSEQVIGTLTAGEAASASSAPAQANEEAAQQSVKAASQQAQTSPAVRKALDEKGLSREEVAGSGKNGRITKSDVQQHQRPAAQPARAPNQTAPIAAAQERPPLEERVPMSRMRKRIAERLLEASQSTAMLTTFNEVNMQPVMDARKNYKDLFEKQFGVRLGFMSFFVRACAQALLRHPDVNASIDGSDLLYHGHCDIGIAVSTERGLVVPVLRSAENMTFAEIEGGINDFAARARTNKLTMDDLTGGTFSITNGGVFGSLMSTPLLNPPQSAILGMHSIQQRPVVENGQVVVRPMMYLALSYDHRIIDGKTSVTFLRNVKEMLEDPIRLIMNV
jgi:2-oxoglutarate dehydrogenase E2 component (dihydrolipoamide succinyltransferase)